MANMNPPFLDAPSSKGEFQSHISRAERRVWEALQQYLNSDWHVLHSLWMRSHRHKAVSEADFVAIGPPGVLVLEVKGGAVERAADGQWLFYGSNGQLNDVKREGPFEQARGAMFALKTHLERSGAGHLWRGHVWGYGIITPECTLRVPPEDPGIHAAMALGETGFPERIGEFIAGLIAHWQERWRGRRADSQSLRPLSPRDRDALVTLLRPKIGHVKGLGVIAHRVRHEIHRLTSEQQRALEFAALEPRHILVGGAGTGKTMLALEQARGEAAKGRRVLFTCFNRHLADRLAALGAKDVELRNVEFLNYHQLLGRLLHAADAAGPVPEGWDEFNRTAETLVFEALDRLPDWRPYDALVVDEAQDLMTPEFMSVLELMVEQGLSEGRWTICLDPNQAIFNSQYDEQTARRFIGMGHRISLSRNCRNTRSIHAYLYGLGRLEAAGMAAADGPHPRIEYYSGRADFRRRIRGTLNELIEDFRSAGIEESQIVVLFAREGAFLDDLMSEAPRIVAPISEFLADAPGGNSVKWSTVQAFKGLEAHAVVLVGIGSLREPWERRLYYVGASRAQAVLSVLLPEQEQNSVQLAMTDVLAILAEDGTGSTSVG